MARKSDGVALLVGLVLVGIAFRGAKRGARPSQFRRWSDHDASAFVDALTGLGVPIEALLAVYAAESGLDPKATSGISWGLCQAIESTLRDVGWFAKHKRAAEFGQLTVAEQAPWVARVVAYQIRMIGYTPKDALELYVANFSPMAARARADVIYRSGSAAYDKNRSLDVDRKGYIAKSDLARALERAVKSEPYLVTLPQVQRLIEKRKASNG